MGVARSNLGQSLLQISDQIRGILDADGKPHQSIGDFAKQGAVMSEGGELRVIVGQSYAADTLHSFPQRDVLLEDFEIEVVEARIDETHVVLGPGRAFAVSPAKSCLPSVAFLKANVEGRNTGG